MISREESPLDTTSRPKCLQIANLVRARFSSSSCSIVESFSEIPSASNNPPRGCIMRVTYFHVYLAPTIAARCIKPETFDRRSSCKGKSPRARTVTRRGGTGEKKKRTREERRDGRLVRREFGARRYRNTFVTYPGRFRAEHL